jgi:hypothetical protein
LDDLHAFVVAGKAFDRTEAEQQLLEAMPDEDEDDEEGFDAAVGEDALAAALYAVRASREDPCRNAAWAARRTYDTVDRFVSRLLNESEYTSSAERFIDEHPLTIQEVERQHRDIRDIRAALASSEAAQLSDVLARSRQESCLSILA